MPRNKKKTYKTLLSVLANGSTEQSADLLKRYSGGNAKNVKDLEVQLARVYALTTDKRGIEKEFAEIHPHKEFILKYVAPNIQPLGDITEKEVKPLVMATTKKMVMLDDGYSNEISDKPCGCSKCMGYSNASGDVAQNQTQGNQNVMVLGIVSVVAILGMILYLNKNK